MCGELASCNCVVKKNFPLSLNLRDRSHETTQTVQHYSSEKYNALALIWSYFSPFPFLLQGFASPCTRLWPVKLLTSLLLPSLWLSPNPRTSTCQTWDHATMEPAQTSTAWSLRTFDPHSPCFC